MASWKLPTVHGKLRDNHGHTPVIFQQIGSDHGNLSENRMPPPFHPLDNYNYIIVAINMNI